MTDKEFKRLNRAQLIDIIYQLQLQIEKLNEEKQALESELADKRLRLHNVGKIADAALEINDCFCHAQNAAEQYLNEIRVIREEAEKDRQKLLTQTQSEAYAILVEAKKKEQASDSAIAELWAETEAERQRILAQAQAEAAAIVSDAQMKQKDLDSAIEMILEEYKQSHSDNG